MAYVPKINKDALLQGYIGADPKKVGALRGYLQKQVSKKGDSK